MNHMHRRPAPLPLENRLGNFDEPPRTFLESNLASAGRVSIKSHAIHSAQPCLPKIETCSGKAVAVEECGAVISVSSAGNTVKDALLHAVLSLASVLPEVWIVQLLGPLVLPYAFSFQSRTACTSVRASLG